MTTTFAASLKLCGIDHAGAANYLDQPIERIEGWCIDASGVPMDVWRKLASLLSELHAGNDAATDVINEFGLPPNWQNDFAMGGMMADAPEGVAEASGAMAILLHFSMQYPSPRPSGRIDWGQDEAR